MNRYLLAGCAAVALAMGSGAANAQAKFEVKIGGDVFAEWGYVDQDRDTGLRSNEMRNRFRVNLIPSAKADNGLEYGARLRFRASNGSTSAVNRSVDADRAYIFAQGGFGQVRIGTSNTYNDETVVSRPIDYLPFGLFDQALSHLPGATAANGTDITGGNLVGLNAGSMVWPTFGDVATRIVYFSPRIAGFQLGASYTPRNDDSANSIQRSQGPVSTTILPGSAFTTSYQDLLEVGANFDQTFGGIRVRAGAGYYWGEASDVGGAAFKDLNAWQAGAQVAFAGASVGGSYTDWGKSGINKSPAASPFRENARVWQAGAQYTLGPIVLGGGWMYGKDSGSFAAPGERDINVYEIGASYTVAPGFAVQAQYDYFEADSDVAGRDDKGSVVILRTTLAF